MKKKNIWDYYNGKSAAPGQKAGSLFVRVLLAAGILGATLTLVLSLFYYFFPVQAMDTAQAVKTFFIDAAENIKRYQQEAFSHPSEEEDIPSLVPSTVKGDVEHIGSEEAPGTIEIDYLVMLDTAMGPMLYYNQRDSQWGDHLYGGEDPIYRYGCGPTVVAMLINAFTEEATTPEEMADWCADHGYHAPKSGSYHSIIPETLSAYGLGVESVKDYSYDNAAELLQSGHVLVALMGRGAFTSQGHFIIITQMLDNGNVYIADCNSLENTSKEWDLNQILEELKYGARDGGPLWVVDYGSMSFQPITPLPAAGYVNEGFRFLF